MTRWWAAGQEGTARGSGSNGRDCPTISFFLDFWCPQLARLFLASTFERGQDACSGSAKVRLRQMQCLATFAQLLGFQGDVLRGPNYTWRVSRPRMPV